MRITDKAIADTLHANGDTVTEYNVRQAYTEIRTRLGYAEPNKAPVFNEAKLTRIYQAIERIREEHARHDNDEPPRVY